MLNLKRPSSTKTYRIAESNKRGDWYYDNQDTATQPNEGTVLTSLNEKVPGRFKRVFKPQSGIDIDWFLTKDDAIINNGLQQAMLIAEQINFGNRNYVIDTITVRPEMLFNPQKLVFDFQNSTFIAKNGLRHVSVIRIEDIPALNLLGNLTLNGNASKIQIVNPIDEGGEAFLYIVAPENNPKSILNIGSITIKNMPMCGITIDTHDNFKGIGYDRIVAKLFREINGFNHLNIQKDDFAIWGFNVRGAHRAVMIDSLYAQQDNEPWGDAPIEKPFYTFTFENQVDPVVHTRKDSLYVKNFYAQNPCSLVLYTQAVNHVLIDNYLIDGALCKPNVDNERAYPTMLQKNISWVGSKHTWTSYHSPKSSFEIKKLIIRNTSPAFMNKAINDITGLWLNKAIKGAIFGEVETDVRLKFYGDGYYFGFTDIPEGGHRVRKFVCNIPSKRNYVQPFNGDLTIDSLYLSKRSGVIMRRSNAKIGTIKQENGTKATFEN